MASIVIGSAILAFTLLKGGEALLPLFGRARNDVFDLAWPLSLWLLWLVGLYVLVPITELLPEARRATTLAAAVAAVSLLHGVKLALVWRRMRRAG
jgi:hypothetical protein